MKAITGPTFDLATAAKRGFAILATGLILWTGVLLASSFARSAASDLREISERSRRITILEDELARLTAKIAENLDAIGADDLSTLGSPEAIVRQLGEDRAAVAAAAKALELTVSEPGAPIEAPFTERLST